MWPSARAARPGGGQGGAWDAYVEAVARLQRLPGVETARRRQSAAAEAAELASARGAADTAARRWAAARARARRAVQDAEASLQDAGLEVPPDDRRRPEVVRRDPERLLERLAREEAALEEALTALDVLHRRATSRRSRSAVPPGVLRVGVVLVAVVVLVLLVAALTG